MNTLKRFTQSVTAILVMLLVVVVGSVLAIAMNASGLTRLIDGLADVSTSWFWITMIGSRWLFGAIWAIAVWVASKELKEEGWFWFAKPEPMSRWDLDQAAKDRARIDKSLEVLTITFAIFIVGFLAFVFSEAMIRLWLGTLPSYFQ